VVQFGDEACGELGVAVGGGRGESRSAKPLQLDSQFSAGSKAVGVGNNAGASCAPRADVVERTPGSTTIIGGDGRAISALGDQHDTMPLSWRVRYPAT